MSPRATPLTPDERRATLVDATVPLLLEHGRTVTTRQIADAAGVAEGTIFRVFDSKDELVLCAVEQAMDFEPFLAEVAVIDPDLPLRERLIEVVTRLQQRFTGIFALMSAMGMVGPPRAHRHMAEGRHRTDEALLRLVETDADRFRLPAPEVLRVLRLLTFSGSHPHIADGALLSPEQIVSIVLDGLLRDDDDHEGVS